MVIGGGLTYPPQNFLGADKGDTLITSTNRGFCFLDKGGPMKQENDRARLTSRLVLDARNHGVHYANMFATPPAVTDDFRVQLPPREPRPGNSEETGEGQVKH